MAKGEEVQWCYNKFTNRDLLENYGFVSPLPNPYDSVKLQKYDQSISHGSDWLVLDGMTRSSAQEGFELVRFASFTSQTERFRTWLCKGVTDDCAPSALTPRAKTALSELLRRFPSTRTEDLALMQSADQIGMYGKYVLLYRASIKDLLQSLLDAL